MMIMNGDLMDRDADGRRLLTLRSAADVLSISRGAIYNLLDAGELTSIHIGRARRIPLAELRRFVDQRIRSSSSATQPG